MSTITVNAKEWADLQERVSKLEKMLFTEVSVQLSGLAKEVGDLKAPKAKKTATKTSAATKSKNAVESDESSSASDVSSKTQASGGDDASPPNDSKDNADNDASADKDKKATVIDFFRSSYDNYEEKINEMTILKHFLADLKVPSKKTKDEEKKTKAYHLWRFMKKNSSACNSIITLVEGDFKQLKPTSGGATTQPAKRQSKAPAPSTQPSNVEQEDIEEALTLEPEN